MTDLEAKAIAPLLSQVEKCLHDNNEVIEKVRQTLRLQAQAWERGVRDAKGYVPERLKNPYEFEAPASNPAAGNPAA